MESLAKVDLKRRRVFDSSKCFLCTERNAEGLVASSSDLSFETLCDAVNKLANWNNDDALKAVR